MGEPNSDLWSEFEDENVDNEFAGKLNVLNKKTNADGSEWAGKFDRRDTPRDENSDSANSENSEDHDLSKKPGSGS